MNWPLAAVVVATLGAAMVLGVAWLVAGIARMNAVTDASRLELEAKAVRDFASTIREHEERLTKLASRVSMMSAGGKLG